MPTAARARAGQGLPAPLFSASGASRSSWPRSRRANSAPLSHLMHEGHQRCGGYVVHSTWPTPCQSMAQPISQNLFSAPPLTQGQRQPAAAPSGSGQHSRHHRPARQLAQPLLHHHHGVQSADWVAGQWQTLSAVCPGPASAGSSTAAIHSNPVVLTLRGSRYPDEVVVLGGHLDSTAGSAPTAAPWPRRRRRCLRHRHP